MKPYSDALNLDDAPAMWSRVREGFSYDESLLWSKIKS